ncbi:MAG: membrane-bound lytic murein transglycosylase F [Zhongshania sp.]|jgi:membrane-bound lytic murein transglycosylase F
MKIIVGTMSIVLLLAVITACSQGSPSGNSAVGRTVAEIKASGELLVLSRNAPTTYYLNRENQAVGAEYELAMAFADSLGVKLRLIVEDNVSDILQGVRTGKGDFAAAGLSKTKLRGADYLFTTSIDTVTEQVVCRRGGNVAKSLADLASVSLEVPKESSYEESLRALQDNNPAITWNSNETSGTEPLLQKVWEGKLDCSVADSNIVAVNRRFLPELIVMFDLAEPKYHVWLMSKNSNDLRVVINQWMASAAGKAALDLIHYRHYSYIEDFDFVDTRALVKRIDERLPQYLGLFDIAAEKHAFSSALLAAQAYQESHWDAKARSPSGVRGIMMLTLNTAKSLGVKNRLDPKQAIPGGAAYLAKMRDRFSEDIPDPDRTYMALAAYNVGRAHMHDAQVLARKLGKDPLSWVDIREVLPKLSDKRYYKDLKYGYARGMEPVVYVQRIRNYENIILEKLNQ